MTRQCILTVLIIILRIEYNKQSEDIEYIINFSQKIKVNTEADEAFNIYLGRNVDDLVNAVQNVLDINDQISKIESMQKEGQYSDEASQKKLSDIMEGLTKQRDFAKSKMKDAFEGNRSDAGLSGAGI